MTAQSSGCNVYKASGVDRLVLELCNGALFRVTSRNFLPPNIWNVLNSFQGAVSGEQQREWRFPLASYRDVLAQLRTHTAFRECQVDALPEWLLVAVRDAENAKDRRKTQEHHEQLNRYLANLPLQMKRERPIMEFQKEGILFGLSRGGRCLLGDEMGLGKTLQALAIIANYVSDLPALVIAPSALRMVWRDQALAWPST
jgi:SNF2 family DNA or RNA helicase